MNLVNIKFESIDMNSVVRSRIQCGINLHVMSLDLLGAIVEKLASLGAQGHQNSLIQAKY